MPCADVVLQPGAANHDAAYTFASDKVPSLSVDLTDAAQTDLTAISLESCGPVAGPRRRYFQGSKSFVVPAEWVTSVLASGPVPCFRVRAMTYSTSCDRTDDHGSGSHGSSSPAAACAALPLATDGLAPPDRGCFIAVASAGVLRGDRTLTVTVDDAGASSGVAVTALVGDLTLRAHENTALVHTFAHVPDGLVARVTATLDGNPDAKGDVRPLLALNASQPAISVHVPMVSAPSFDAWEPDNDDESAGHRVALAPGATEQHVATTPSDVDVIPLATVAAHAYQVMLTSPGPRHARAADPGRDGHRSGERQRDARRSADQPEGDVHGAGGSRALRAGAAQRRRTDALPVRDRARGGIAVTRRLGLMGMGVFAAIACASPNDEPGGRALADEGAPAPGAQSFGSHSPSGCRGGVCFGHGSNGSGNHGSGDDGDDDHGDDGHGDDDQGDDGDDEGHHGHGGHGAGAGGALVGGSTGGGSMAAGAANGGAAAGGAVNGGSTSAGATAAGGASAGNVAGASSGGSAAAGSGGMSGAVTGDAPAGLVPERDPAGGPAMYYARVRVSSRGQVHLLDTFGFVRDVHPFFDEFKASMANSQALKSAFGERWVYVLATGVQMNFLIGHPGLVDAVELNPEQEGVDHPALDSFRAGQTGGSISTKMLIDNGFDMKPLRLHPVCSSSQGPGVTPEGFFGDVLDVVEAPFEAAVSLAEDVANILDKIGLGPDDIKTLITAAVQGIEAAIDEIRTLANEGVCAIVGKYRSSGVLYPTDRAGNPVTDVGRTTPAPLRSGTIWARGGPLDILHTSATPGADGVFRFDDLCNGIDYDLAVEYDSDVAWVSTNGILAEEDEFLPKAPDAPEPPPAAALDADGARWFLAAQLGRDFSIQQLAMVPNKALILHGGIIDDTIGALNGHRSVTPCQVQDWGILLAGISLPAAVVAYLLSADIWGSDAGFEPGSVRGIGMAIHEYGHHTFCSALDQSAGIGTRDDYMVHLLETIVAHVSNDAQQHEPIRNTAESWADLFAYASTGYTDYVQTDDPGSVVPQGPSLCPASPSSSDDWSGAMCLEPDARFRLPADQKPDGTWPQILGSRLSVMYDWLDQGSDDTIRLAYIDLLNAAVASTPNFTTETAAASLAGTDGLGTLLGAAPAGTPVASPDGLCAIFENHAWDCSSVSMGITPQAPIGFDGIGTSVTTIHWSWAPTSLLADSYELVQVQNAAWSDVASVPAGSLAVDQTVASPDGNQHVFAAVEARKANASGVGRSIKLERCTLARPVSVLSATGEADGIEVSWTATGGDAYVVQRAEPGGDFAPIATVSASTFLDGGAPPGVDLRYRVDALNCNGVPNPGTVATHGTTSASDDAFVYVRPGATGGSGTKTAPMGTITDALPLLTATRHTVVLAEGSYPERIAIDGVVVDEVAEVDIVGGYDASFATRDVGAHPSVLVGTDGFAGYLHYSGGGEFLNSFNVLIAARHRDVSLDGVTVDPRLRSCAGTCQELSLASARHLTLTGCTVFGPAGDFANLGSNVSPLTRMVDAEVCDVVDTTIDGLDSTDRGMLTCSTSATVSNSRILAGTRGSGVSSQDGTLRIDRSVIRGDRASWDATGSSGASARCLTITNSIVAGAQAVSEGAILDVGDCTATTHGVFGSTIYGQAFGDTLRFVDDILVGNDVLIDQADGLGCGDSCSSPAGGNTVRANVFVALNGQAPAATAFAKAHGSADGSIDPSSLNDSGAWFGGGINDIGGNQYTTNMDAVFDATATEQDPTNLANGGRVLHIRLGSLAKGTGVDMAAYGIAIGLDLDGVARFDAMPDAGAY